MAEPKILMLGWHFSTYISGGMGEASYQIAKSISEKINLTIILPSFDEKKHPLKANIIDVSKITQDIIKTDTINYVHHYTSTESLIISPYQSIQHNKNNSTEETYTSSSPIQLAIENYNNIVVDLALKEEFDIIHCHDWMTFAAGIALKNITGKKLVVHIHSLEYDRGNSDNWIFGLERKAMDMADSIICVSNYSKEIARKYYNIYLGKIQTIYNGIDLDEKVDRAIKDERNIVTFAGRLTEKKGIKNFIKIALQVYDRIPGTQFVIAGDGDLNDEIKNIIHSLPQRENFHQLGHLEKEELQVLFAGSDVLCMPSISEPFGMVALEAANQRAVCIISKQSGAAEILTSSLKADSNDIDGFASNIISVLEDNSLKQNIAKAQSEEIKDFVWAKTANEIMEVYKEILQN